MAKTFGIVFMDMPFQPDAQLELLKNLGAKPNDPDVMLDQLKELEMNFNNYQNEGSCANEGGKPRDAKRARIAYVHSSTLATMVRVNPGRRHNTVILALCHTLYASIERGAY